MKTNNYFNSNGDGHHNSASAAQGSAQTATAPRRFRSHAMGYAQLAMAYFPDTKREAAVRRLRRWIIADRQLRRALETAGWRKGLHQLTTQQVKAFGRIVKFLCKRNKKCIFAGRNKNCNEKEPLY